MNDLISRQEAIDAVTYGLRRIFVNPRDVAEQMLNRVPSAQPERKHLSNREMIDFLTEQFSVSRTSAKEMLHGLMRWKAEDNFKKQFSGGINVTRR